MAGLFDEWKVRDLRLKNRIVISPMCQYQAEDDGLANDWHVVHYGSMALGGAALLVTEATAVEARGRISHADLGLWNAEQMAPLRRIVDFAHKWGTQMGVQLSHAGRKAELNHAIVAPSATPFSSRYQVPLELTHDDIADITKAFADAAKRAVAIGFDMVEIHGAHGYLIHQFLSPVSNQRQDEYGGSVENRMRFPLEVIRAVRSVVPEGMPVFIRVSGSEYAADGYTLEEMVDFCRAFREAGVDVVDVSSGGNLPVRPPAIYAGYQVPFADVIRTRAMTPVAAVGILDDPVLADAVIQEGRADLVVIGRGFLRNKHWAHAAAQSLGHPVQPPKPYERAYS